MIRADARDSRRRPAFTLIEIIVVMTIILILSGIVIAFLTGYNGPSASARATMVQQALTIARTEAIRGRRPYGVRLIPDSTNSYVSILQFIEQPDDYFGGRILVPSANSTTINFADVDLFGGFGNSPSQNPVLVGDYIELCGTGLVRQIVAMVPSTVGGSIVCQQVTVATALPFQINLSPTPPGGVPVPNQFRIIRMPRVVGEEPITLPDDTAIDITTNVTYGNALPIDWQTQNIDILFSPSGAVIGRGTTETPIFLWVRNITYTGVTNGDPTIIALYPRTGSNAAQPIYTPNPATPYYYAQDGRSSGL